MPHVTQKTFSSASSSTSALCTVDIHSRNSIVSLKQISNVVQKLTSSASKAQTAVDAMSRQLQNNVTNVQMHSYVYN